VISRHNILLEKECHVVLKLTVQITLIKIQVNKLFLLLIIGNCLSQ